MSTLAIPMPKTAGGRPPFGGPPTKTSFDPRPDDQGEPLHRVIADSVRILLNACKSANEENAASLLRLISQRKRLVEQELFMIRMMASQPMPPTLNNLFSLEFLGDEGEAERIYVQLLGELDDAFQNIHRIEDIQTG